jgi:hypothetical protein
MTIDDTNEDTYIGDASLQEIEGFPYSEWSERLEKYKLRERWFTGQELEDQPEMQKAGKKADLYPMRINPIISTVLKHAFVLFGEVEDDGRPLVWPKLIPRGKEEEAKTQAEEAEEILNIVWWENAARATMIHNSILSQIYGGCIFKAVYAPWETWRTIPIKVELINPKNFIGYPDGSNPFRLSEAWFLRKVSGNEAKRWGLENADPEYKYWYVEHWFHDNYQTWINGEPVKRDGRNIGGDNIFGEVPAVYIPHVRIGGFYGDNAYDHLTGYVKEMNRVIGDYGDAVNDDSHPIIAARNVQGGIQTTRVNEYLTVVDLGVASNITGDEAQPDLFEVRTPRASIAMQNLFDEVYQQYRRDAFVPAVADGEDEGSQRSALTLNTRFWPLTSHAKMERFNWSSGMDVFQPLLLNMVSKVPKERLKNVTIADYHLGMRMKQKWAPMLPRDREADMNEWVQRQANQLGGIRHMLELTGDVEDIDEGRDEILEDIRDITKIEAEEAAKAVNKYPPPIQNTFGQQPAKKPAPKGGSND